MTLQLQIKYPNYFISGSISAIINYNIIFNVANVGLAVGLSIFFIIIIIVIVTFSIITGIYIR